MIGKTGWARKDVSDAANRAVDNLVMLTQLFSPNKGKHLRSDSFINVE